MDISIPGPSMSPSYSSHNNPLKRPSERVANIPKGSSPKRRKQISSRTISEITVDNDDIYNSHLSAKTKETVYKLKKISDPFDPQLQEVVDDVFDHFDQNADGDVDLAESALLLSSVTHVYTSQVKTLHEEVLAIANRLSGKETVPKGRQRKKNGDTEASNADKKSDDVNPDGTAPSDENASKEGEEKKPDAGTIDEVVDLEKEGESSPDIEKVENGIESTNPDEHSNGGAEDNTPPSDVPGTLNAEGSTESTLHENEKSNDMQLGENNGAEDQKVLNPEDQTTLESEILLEIPGRCTRRTSDRLKNILNIEKEWQMKEREYSLKKRKYDDDPPELISCFDEWNECVAQCHSEADLNFDDVSPPVLEVQVGRNKRKLITINNNLFESDEIDCETCHTNTSDGVEKTEAEKIDSSLKLEMDSSLNGQYKTLDHLPNDVQETFHALIQEMHKLPFDYDLMQQDMFKTYQQKFLQAVSLLSQNSVLVKRSETADGEGKDMMVKVIELNDTQMSESDQTISSIAELLNQVRQQASEEYNKGKQSKLDAEVPVSQMIATLKRIICSRYKKWHVRTDGDREVFKRIKEFEDKVKSVLIKEAEQGLFDVRKYEMEVMDVTIKCESQDPEVEESYGPLSPILPPQGAESPIQDEAKNWALACSSRRSSIAESIDGSGWIRLYDIFSHMKKIDNSETCRHFYAVLALLSHKNLNINFENLFSQESAKLITKLLKRRNEDTAKVKYPVGAAIMTSRCPDVDRDEVLLSPFGNQETLHNILEQQDGYLSSSGYQSDGQGSSSTSGNNGYSQSRTIQDAINDFVIDPGEPLPDDFFSIRRRKKQ